MQSEIHDLNDIPNSLLDERTKELKALADPFLEECYRRKMPFLGVIVMDYEPKRDGGSAKSSIIATMPESIPVEELEELASIMLAQLMQASGPAVIKRALMLVVSEDESADDEEENEH